MSAFFDILQESVRKSDNYEDMHFQCELEALKIIRPTIIHDSKFPHWFKESGGEIIKQWWDTEEAKTYWDKTRHSKLLIEFTVLFHRLGQYFGSDMEDPLFASKKMEFKIN